MVITCVIMNDAQCVTSMKRIKQKDSQTTWKKTNIVLNSSDGIRKSKKKNTICAWHECKRTLLQKHNKNIIRSWQRYIPKISVK
jgi:hypothetical protein